MLDLKRPIVAFDFEATGQDPVADRAVQFGAIRLGPSGDVEEQVDLLINPERPITNSDIHGVTDAMVRDRPPFRDSLPIIGGILDGADFVTFNGRNYDVIMLSEEMARCGVDLLLDGVHHIDVGNLYKKMRPRTLVAAVQEYLGDNHNAHRALDDAIATYQVLMGQLATHEAMQGKSVEELAELSAMERRVDLAGKFMFNDQGVVVFGFGKHKGAPVIQEPGFIRWMLDKDFSADTRRHATRILEGIQ